MYTTLTITIIYIHKTNTRNTLYLPPTVYQGKNLCRKIFSDKKQIQPHIYKPNGEETQQINSICQGIIKIKIKIWNFEHIKNSATKAILLGLYNIYRIE